MKVILPQIDYVFECDGDRCCSIVIENQNTFLNAVTDIFTQVDGGEGKSVLSEDNKVISMAKHCEIISQFVPLDINQKSILNKVAAKMQSIAMDEVHYIKTNELMGALESHLMELSLEMVGNFDFPKINIDSMIKASGVRINDLYAELGEKLLDYFELVREYDTDKLFVLVGIRNYMSDDEMERFLESILTREINILMIEGSCRALLENEKRHIVDEDLCVIC